MTLKFARELLNRDTAMADAATGGQAWDEDGNEVEDPNAAVLFDHAGELVWAENGDEVEQFNTVAASFPGIPGATIDGEDDNVHMSYRGARVRVPLEFNGEDNLRSVYTLSQLTKADLEFRMCKETAGNSEQAFLLLPPGQWAELDSEFGTEAVARCFLPLAPTFDAFMKEAFAESEEGMSDQELATKRFADAVVAEANRCVPCEYARNCDENGYVEVSLFTETNAQRDRLYKEAGFRSALNGLVPTLQAHGLRARCILIESHETANERWHGLFLDVPMRASSPHIWFNRGPDDRQPLWRRAYGAISRIIS